MQTVCSSHTPYLERVCFVYKIALRGGCMGLANEIHSYVIYCVYGRAYGFDPLASIYFLKRSATTNRWKWKMGTENVNGNFM